MGQFFSGYDYQLALPMLLLTLFALGILMIDLLLPPQWKVLNAWTAFAGLVFSGVAVYRTQHFLQASCCGHVKQLRDEDLKELLAHEGEAA